MINVTRITRRCAVILVIALLLVPLQPAQAAACQPLPLRVFEAATPSQITARGGLVTYQVTLHNPGSCVVTDAELVLPVDARSQQIVDFSSPRPASWVRIAAPDQLLVTLGPLEPQTSLTLSYRLRTRTDAPDGTLISRRAVVIDGSSAQPRAHANRNDLRVGPADRHVTLFALATSSDHAVQGTPIDLAASLFMPAEPVSIWTSDHLQQYHALGVVTADADGRVALSYDSSRTPDGPLTFVAYGQWSALTARAVVIVGLIGSSSPQAADVPPDLPYSSTATGRDLRVTIAWQVPADLALHVTEPSGAVIDQSQPQSAADGLLEHSADCSDPLDLHRESIAWPSAAAPLGSYAVTVQLQVPCNATPPVVPFQLYVDVGDGIVYRYDASVSAAAGWQHTVVVSDAR